MAKTKRTITSSKESAVFMTEALATLKITRRELAKKLKVKSLTVRRIEIGKLPLPAKIRAAVEGLLARRELGPTLKERQATVKAAEKVLAEAKKALPPAKEPAK